MCNFKKKSKPNFLKWKNVVTLCSELNEMRETTMGSKIISKESWHLPTLVAGVMHNIEPAHHALQQGVE